LGCAAFAALGRRCFDAGVDANVAMAPALGNGIDAGGE
jgi:hypothetical protein